MKNIIQNKLTLGLLVVLLSVIFVASSNKAEAQYCGFGNVLYWYPYGMVNGVTLTDITEGEVIIDRQNSGGEGWATVDKTGGPYDMNIGNNFEIKVNWGVYYQGYVRVFLDRNDDQRWELGIAGADKEFVGYQYQSAGFNYPAQPVLNTTFPITIGDDTPEGPSVLRVIANYYYYSDNACQIYYQPGYPYGYGEAEDYAINFVAPVPETYPTAGNILFNKQRYDGTTRDYQGETTDFKLPS
jgi:hypothetical protein